MRLEDIQTRPLNATTVEASFRQIHGSARPQDVATTVQTWQQINGQWSIVKEASR